MVMTFVINLAVPPLLFAQVLYGRALYTSSVLIASIGSRLSASSCWPTGCSIGSPRG